IYQPELVCVLESAASQKGVNLENNLVHLTGHLALYQSRGVQPFWIREGVALGAESTVLGTLYSFCAGGRFVPMAQRGWWRRKRDAYWRDQATLQLERVLGLNQREFDHEGSLLAFSVVRYLAGQRAEGFGHLLDALRDERDAHLAQDRNYEVSAAKQQQL